MQENLAGDGARNRRLLARLGAGALAFGAFTALSGRKARAATPTGSTGDAAILNFALNLEYLEAEYYLRAVTGSGLPSTLTGPQAGTVLAPTTTLVPFQTPAISGWAQRIANDELAHVNFLRVAIASEGGTPISEPNIDLLNSFNTLAVAAGLVPAGGTFNPFASELNFLIGSYIFEDVGVTAYAGSANQLTNPANISYGASILAVEAEHSGAVRGYLSQIGGGAVTNAISAVRQTLSGVQDNGTNLSATGGNPFTFVNSDYNGQVFRRTPLQVLNIVYGNTSNGVTPGLFFPSGINT